MKVFYFCVLMTYILFDTSCNYQWNERVRGNGKIISEQRKVSNANKLNCSGSFDVNIISGAASAVNVEADENLLSYIITEEKNGYLLIQPKNGVNISSSNKIKITVTTTQLLEVHVAGSGDVAGEGKFTGSDYLKLDIGGSGNISLEVNTPTIDANIAGSGNINLSGETKKLKINIAGNGDYKGENLKTENADVSIAGSGNVKVFADATLKVNIIGSGDVYYAGNAIITKNIIGSGSLKKIE